MDRGNYCRVCYSRNYDTTKLSHPEQDTQFVGVRCSKWDETLKKITTITRTSSTLADKTHHLRTVNRGSRESLIIIPAMMKYTIYALRRPVVEAVIFQFPS